MPKTPGVRQLDTARVLRWLGLRGELHPRDAVAFSYPDREVFEASAQRDREVHGNDVHGPYETETGPVAVVDLRPQLRTRGVPPTPPSLPDDAAPGSSGRREGAAQPAGAALRRPAVQPPGLV